MLSLNYIFKLSKTPYAISYMTQNLLTLQFRYSTPNYLNHVKIASYLSVYLLYELFLNRIFECYAFLLPTLPSKKTLSLIHVRPSYTHYSTLDANVFIVILYLFTYTHISWTVPKPICKSMLCMCNVYSVSARSGLDSVEMVIQGWRQPKLRITNIAWLLWTHIFFSTYNDRRKLIPRAELKPNVLCNVLI